METIKVTQAQNKRYFGNKLSKKQKPIYIERNVYNNTGSTGTITRRGASKLYVELDGNVWVITGEAKEEQTTVSSKPIKKSTESSVWQSLTSHQQRLITAVKFDIHEEWEECERVAEEASKNVSAIELLNNIPRFEKGDTYKLGNDKIKIISNNGTKVAFYGPNGEDHRSLECDTTGECIWIEKICLHSADKILQKKEDEDEIIY